MYFDRGRSRRWIPTCRNCAYAKQQFRGPSPHTKIPTGFQKIKAWYAIFDVVIEQHHGNPIALVEATKIAASRNETAKDYFDVKDKFSKEKCGETFLELIHYLITHSRCYMRDLKEIIDFSNSTKSADSSSIQVASQKPIMMVKYVVDVVSTVVSLMPAIEETKERKKEI
jgi:hypothetical protein